MAGGLGFGLEFRGAASFAFFFSAKGAGFDPSDFSSTQYSLLTGTFTNAYTYDAASNRTVHRAGQQHEHLQLRHAKETCSSSPLLLLHSGIRRGRANVSDSGWSALAVAHAI